MPREIFERSISIFLPSEFLGLEDKLQFCSESGCEFLYCSFRVPGAIMIGGIWSSDEVGSIGRDDIKLFQTGFQFRFMQDHFDLLYITHGRDVVCRRHLVGLQDSLVRVVEGEFRKNIGGRQSSKR